MIGSGSGHRRAGARREHRNPGTTGADARNGAITIGMNASPLENVAWDACPFEPRSHRELDAYSRRRMGVVNPANRFLGRVPWLARALVDLHPEFGLLMRLEPPVADILGLVVSQQNSCRYCFAAVRSMMWLQGMGRERIERIERDLASADLPPKTRSLVAYGRSQSRSGPAEAREAWRALRRAGVAAEELREAAFTVALTDFSNRVSTFAAIPPRPFERLPEQWFMKLLRPLVGHLMRRHSERGRSVPPPEPPPGPFARLVAVYAGSPIAPTLARTLDAMWRSPGLTQRCKLLLFAVVARGLPCEVCELELTEALRDEGLDAATLAGVLTRLDAPCLDATERVLLPFARETIWYEPAVVQRRARTLAATLGDEAAIEAIGVTALANALVRMAAVVVEDPT